MIVTGFDVWDDIAINPSGLIAEALGGQILPVNFTDTPLVAERLLSESIIQSKKQKTPARIVCLGLRRGADRFYSEAVALNIVDHLSTHRSVIDSAPLAYSADYHEVKLIAELLDGLVSFHAGTFVCNQLFFCLLHQVAIRKLAVKVNFIHCPEIALVSASQQQQQIAQLLSVL